MTRFAPSFLLVAGLSALLGIASATADPHRSARRAVHITFSGIYTVDGPVERDMEAVPTRGDIIRFGEEDLIVTRVEYDVTDPDAPKTIVGVSTFTTPGDR